MDGRPEGPFAQNVAGIAGDHANGIVAVHELYIYDIMAKSTKIKQLRKITLDRNLWAKGK